MEHASSARGAGNVRSLTELRLARRIIGLQTLGRLAESPKLTVVHTFASGTGASRPLYARAVGGRRRPRP